MITLEKINELATKYQMPIIENVIREYLQHLFLSHLYGLEGAENIMFKGGTALRIVYRSPRFSKDLDFSLFNVSPDKSYKFIEDRFLNTLKAIEQMGIGVSLGAKSGETAGGYRGEATFTLHNQEAVLPIDVSQRNKRHIKGEIETITSDYIPTYDLWHLPGDLLVEEKIKALFEREKRTARDFYDLYFMLRKGLVGVGQKGKLLQDAKELVEKTDIDFETDLKPFLPLDRHQIIKHLRERLIAELARQLGGVASA